MRVVGLAFLCTMLLHGSLALHAQRPQIRFTTTEAFDAARLGPPMVSGGGTGAHAPNEIMVIEPAADSRIAGLARIEKFYVDMLHALAAAR